MSENTVFYDSAKYKYQAKITLKTMAMSKTSRTSGNALKEYTIEPTRIIAYDHVEYVQIDMVMDSNNPEKEALYNMFVAETDVSALEAAYPEKVIWSLVDIVPNGLFMHNKLELYSINNIVTARRGKDLLMSFCAPAKYVSVYVNNDVATGFTYKNLDRIVEYEILTEKEVAFVKEDAASINSLDFGPKKEKKQGNGFLNSMFGVKKKPDEDAPLSATALINSLHLTEQEKQIFDPEMLTVSAGISNSEEALNNLIGLENVKSEVKKLKHKLIYRKRQQDRGIRVEDASSMHMCFTGAPGTGKTTVARIITGILYDMGYIKENRCIEVNGQNLKGGYQGQTAIITKLVMKSAKNKVLFIDEAYALFDGYGNGYGKEAVAVILKHMEDERDNTVVIFAGYKNDMEEFLLMNDGLKSRINRYIHFKNYSTEELSKILILSLKKKKLYISEKALGKCVLAFKKAASTERFSNARFVRNLIEKIEYEHAYNTHSTKDIRRQDTIEAEDVPDDVIKELLTHSM